MITISDSLSTAATAPSRNPAYSVIIRDNSIAEPTELIADGSLPYRLRRFQQGDGFYFATATDGTDIYYKRMTSVTNASDWSSGWSLLATAPTPGAAESHDMAIINDRVIVAWQETFPGVIYARESTNQGSSFASEYEVIDLSASETYLNYLSIADDLVIYSRAEWTPSLGNNGLYRIYRTSTGGSWSSDRWDCGWKFAGYPYGAHNTDDIFARKLDTQKYRVLGNWRKAWNSTDMFDWPFAIDQVRGTWGVLEPTFGEYARDSAYGWAVTGLSRQFNGYYFASIAEKYYASYDILGGTTHYDFFLGKTQDMKSYHVVPFSRRGEADTFIYSWMMCGIGSTGDGLICIPMVNTYGYGSNGVVYLIDEAEWFGDDTGGEDITSRVTNDISIKHSANKSSSATISLTCLQDTFDSSNITSPGSKVEIYAGYNTASGEELQKRFTGALQNYSRSINSPKELQANVLDNLYIASTRKQRLPHILKGQNIFYNDFSSSLDLDMFVQQTGAMVISNGSLVAESPGSYLAIAGYDPNDAAVIVARFKFTTDTTNMVFRMIFHGHTLSNGTSLYKTVNIDGNTEKFEYYEYTIYSDGSKMEQVRQYGSTAHSILSENWYWVMARRKHGQLDTWFSNNGTTWTDGGLSAVDIGKGTWAILNTPIGNNGYLGVGAGISDSGRTVEIDNVRIFSLYPPQSGSDVMKYLAGLCNMDTNEKMEIEDTFSGSSFGDEWDTPGVDGTWASNSGVAEGYKSSNAALLACSTEAADIIVHATIEYDSSAGIFVRGNADLSQCYSMVVDSSNVYLKKKDTSWTTLMQIPWTNPDPGGPGATNHKDIILACNGPYISGFMDGMLYVHAHDEDFTTGTCGLVGEGSVGSKSYIHDFWIDGFYVPIDVATVRPGDTAISVMVQVAARHGDGMFFCDKDGSLRWGTFPDTDIDLDARSSMFTMNTVNNTDQLLSFIRVVGNNAYGEVKDRDWGSAMMGYKYESVEDKSAVTKSACNTLAEELLAEARKIVSSSISMIGHPALEIGDVIGVAESPSDAAEPRQLLDYTERIGSVYEMDIAELRSQTEETP